jgi:hypothetical protein
MRHQCTHQPENARNIWNQFYEHRHSIAASKRCINYIIFRSTRGFCLLFFLFNSKRAFTALTYQRMGSSMKSQTIIPEEQSRIFQGTPKTEDTVDTPSMKAGRQAKLQPHSDINLKDDRAGHRSSAGVRANADHLTLPDGLVAKVAERIEKLINPRQETIADAKATAIANRIERINRLNGGGRMTDDVAFKETVSALLTHRISTQDLGKRIAAMPVLATAMCETISKFPMAASPEDQRGLLCLFGCAINAQYRNSTDKLRFPTEFAILATTLNVTYSTLAEAFDVLNLDDRIQRTEKLQDGVKALLQALPKIQNVGDFLNRAIALEVLAMCHRFANDTLKGKIAGKLEKLTLEELDSDQKLLRPNVTAFARDRLVRDFQHLNREEKGRLVHTIGMEIHVLLKDADAGHYLRHKDFLPLFRNVTELATKLPDLNDERLSTDIRNLVADCLAYTDKAIACSEDFAAR